jgi:hypothetical protein
MLTLEQLKAMPAGTIFATGVLPDSAEGLHMTGSGQDLRWVAVRGDIHDWAIYYCPSEVLDIEFIRSRGDKVHSVENIRRAVPCNDEALKMYRK